MIPFTGLSIIIHFIIILIHKASEKYNFSFVFSLIKKEIFSYLIIFFIVGLVTTNAFFLIKSSVRNSPNVQLVRVLFSNQRAVEGSFFEIYNNKYPKIKVVIYPKAGTNSLDSIVDFLVLNNVDSSLGNRTLFAEKFGINNYIGSAEQNIKLLSILKVRYF